MLKSAAAGAHKTESGGVALDLREEAEVRAAAERIGFPVLLQPFVRDGAELLAGLVQDPVLGPLVAFGPGGVLAELIGDASFRIAPLTDLDARELVNEGKAGRLVRGFRRAPADAEALTDLVLRLSRLGEDLPEVAELDLNPVLALTDGCVIVDARIRLHARPPRSGTLTNRETWTLIHGMVIGAIFLLAFAGGLAGLWSLRAEYVTAAGLTERIRRLKIGTTTMALTAWATVLTGSWIVYPWYREKTPDSPKSILLANPDTADWHEFGMEWKEHIAWIAPMLATAAAFIVVYYGRRLARDRTLRNLALALFVAAFTTAAIAGLFGALITKAAPVK
ncbi:MAG TPA: acetate--CoA ligase family protein [Gaiellaceae bacterium]